MHKFYEFLFLYDSTKFSVERSFNCCSFFFFFFKSLKAYVDRHKFRRESDSRSPILQPNCNYESVKNFLCILNAVTLSVFNFPITYLSDSYRFYRLLLLFIKINPLWCNAQRSIFLRLLLMAFLEFVFQSCFYNLSSTLRNIFFFVCSSIFIDYISHFKTFKLSFLFTKNFIIVLCFNSTSATLLSLCLSKYKDTLLQ